MKMQYEMCSCGQVQIGSFLDIVAPMVYLGWAWRRFLLLVSYRGRGLIADSFSICFGHGGIGSDYIQCEPNPVSINFSLT